MKLARLYRATEIFPDRLIVVATAGKPPACAECVTSFRSKNEENDQRCLRSRWHEMKLMH